MKKLLPLLLAIVLPAFLCAQSAFIKGSVTDSAANKPLAYATISLVKALDSTLITFARADSAGVFQMKSIPKGNYRLSASYVGYYPKWITVNVKEGDEVINTGNIIVKDLKSLGDVTVITKRPPVTVNNDTLEF